MKALVVGPQYADSFANNITDTLRRGGHNVVAVDGRGLLSHRLSLSGLPSRLVQLFEEGAKQSPRLRRHVWNRPIDTALRVFSPDLVVSTYGYYLAEQVAHWRKLVPAAAWALWYPDHLSNLAQQHALLAPYDILFFKDRYLVDKLRRFTSIDARYLPEACNPCIHRPPAAIAPEEHAQYRCAVMTAGNLYAYRAAILDRLPPTTDVKLYGNVAWNVGSPAIQRWYTGDYVTGRPKALAYHCARAALNTRHYGEVRSVNARLFEAAGYGAVLLAEGTEQTEEFFRPGLEVHTFDSADELVELVQGVMRQPEDHAAAMRTAAMLRAHREHSYERRLQELLGAFGFTFSTASPAPHHRA